MKLMWASLLIALLSIATQAIALGGAPPTVDCQITYATNPSTKPSLQGNQVRRVGPDNALYFVLIQDDLTGSPDSFQSIQKLNPNCSQAWGVRSEICMDTAGADNCRVDQIIVDHAGRIASTVHYVPSVGTAQTYIEVRSQATGTLIKRSIDLAGLSPSWTNANALTSVRNGTADLDYIAADFAADRIARFNSNLTMTKYVVGLTNADFLSCCETFANEEFIFAGTTPSGSAADWLRINATTGATANSGTSGSRFTGVDEHTPIISYLDSTKAYGAIAGGTIPSTEISYKTLTLAGWSIGAETDFTPNQIDEGGLRDSHSQDYDLDGADNFLICGSYSVAPESRAFIGHFKTSNNTMFWNVTTDLSTETTIFQFCALDYVGDFWGGFEYKTGSDNTVVINHYSGGGFTAISERRNTVVIPTAPESLEGNPIEQAKQFFSDSWNIPLATANWLFGIGVVAIAIVGFARYGRTPLLIAIAAFLGIGLAVVFGFFPVWVLFVLIFLVIAVAGTVLFGSKGGEQE